MLHLRHCLPGLLRDETGAGEGGAASLPVTSWTPCLGHVGTAGILPCSSCFSGLDARMEVTGHASEMPANLQTREWGVVRGGTGDKHGR